MAKKTSAAQKLRYKSYDSSNTWKTNRIAKLEAHLKAHPDDAIATKALEATKTAKAPRRAKFKTSHVNRTSGRVLAQLKRIIRGAANAAVYEQKKQAQEASNATEQVKAERKANRKPRSKKVKA